MLILKHLKTLQHDSIFIQIIFREIVGSLLKSLNLKIMVMRQLPHHHNLFVWWLDEVVYDVKH